MRTATNGPDSDWVSILHLFTLSSFAIAQPLFDLIGKNPDFLVIHGSGPAEVVTLVLVLIFLPTGLLGKPEIEKV